MAVGRRDAALAALLALCAALLYRATAQARFANDGPQLAIALRAEMVVMVHSPHRD